ncbi:MAG: Hsp20/alpha crystallin family protein [Bacteroidia bacterium]|jgi:HSP20 family protein|nr:Hsp20/alpha crystallin family protein [Bacteroidia bacterium]
MTLIKFNPAKEFFRERMMPSEMNSLFDSFFNDGIAKFERNVFFTPRVDVVENDTQFEVHVALPGLKKDEINIDVEKNVMTVSGERKMKNENKGEKFHMVENFYGKFSRSFTLPENVDGTKIDAQFADGILAISLPKSEVKQNSTKVVIK